MTITSRMTGTLEPYRMIGKDKAGRPRKLLQHLSSDGVHTICGIDMGTKPDRTLELEPQWDRTGGCCSHCFRIGTKIGTLQRMLTSHQELGCPISLSRCEACNNAFMLRKIVLPTRRKG